MANQHRRILVYRIGSLGDTIISLPGFNKVLETFPGADITLLTNRPLVNKAAPVETVLDNGVFFHRVLNYPTGTRNPLLLLQLIQQLRALKIDTVVNLATTRIMKNLQATRRAVWRDKLFFKAAGIKHLVGFPEIAEDYLLCIDPETGDNEWEAKRLARRLNGIGGVDLKDDKYWDMRFTLAEVAEADKALSGFDFSKPILAASAGTKRPANDWEEHNWQALLRELRHILPGWQLVMLGAPDEAGRADKCIEAFGGKGINLCGKTSPRVSGAVLQKATIFIGHDSGPMHLSAAVGTPCVAIYSARNFPRQWFPRGDFNQIIYHRTHCAGCLLESCVEQKKKCILTITVDEVKDAVMTVLNNKNLKLGAYL